MFRCFVVPQSDDLVVNFNFQVEVTWVPRTIGAGGRNASETTEETLKIKVLVE